MFLHSDFSYSYTFNWVGFCTDFLASTALPEEQLGQHEILRRHGELRSPPQDDIVEQSSTVGSASAAEHRRFPRKTVRVDGQMRFVGLRPLHPCIASANTAFRFLCKLPYT